MNLDDCTMMGWHIAHKLSGHLLCDLCGSSMVLLLGMFLCISVHRLRALMKVAVPLEP